MDEIAVDDFLHAAAGIVCEDAHVEPLEKAGDLDDSDDADIGEGEPGHGGGRLPAAQNVIETLGKAAFIQRSGQQADVVDETENGDEEQREPFGAEIGENAVRMRNGVNHGTAKLHDKNPATDTGGDGSTDIFSSAWGGLPVIWQIRRQRMRNGVERKRIPPAWRSSFHVSYHRTQQDGVQYPMGNRKEKYIPLGRLWMSNPRKASEQSIILLDMSIVQQ